jgi:hypothetical protein
LLRWRLPACRRPSLGLTPARLGILANESDQFKLEVTIVPNSSIKNEKMYQDLRKQGDSKEKAARISNAAAGRGKSSVARKGGKSGSYADWTVPELKKRAKQLGISGYSGLTKDKLVAKLRNH